jgi:hypothetical protein
LQTSSYGYRFVNFEEKCPRKQTYPSYKKKPK